MHNPAPVLENVLHKLLWDFNIQTNHLIPARRPDLIILNKKKRICKIVDFAVPADHRPEETCGHSDSSEKPSANTDVKNSRGVNNNNNNNKTKHRLIFWFY